jgi:hypothetical protein
MKCFQGFIGVVYMASMFNQVLADQPLTDTILLQDEHSYVVPTDEQMSLIPENLMKLYKNNPNCEFLNKLIMNYDLFLEIHKKCGSRFIYGCGSYLFDGLNYTYCERMYEKQKLLYNVAKKSSAVLEIGVYMGHSMFIMLLANPNIKITGIDIDDFYAGPSLELIKKRFNSEINLIKGDSISTLPLLKEKFDLFHIDGYHDAYHVNFEFLECTKKHSGPHAFFVIDDYDCFVSTVNRFWVNNSAYSVLKVEIPNCSWRNVVAELLFLE